MAEGHHRRKQPVLIRRAILDSAIRIAEQDGLVGVTVLAVAKAAGITKGGLFHHFPNKQSLIEGMLEDVIAKIDVEIDERLRADPKVHGRFTRAYIGTMLIGSTFGLGSPWSTISVSMITEPSLGDIWSKWLGERLRRHKDTDDLPDLEIARFAVDGAWLAYISGSGKNINLEKLRVRLISMTQ